MPSQHKHPPIAFRPPEGDRAWLLTHAALTGQPVNAILADALAAHRRSLVEMAEKLAAEDGAAQ